MKIKILLVIIALFFMHDLALANMDPLKKDEKAFTDPNKPIMLTRAARTFTIKLKSNPTTGYVWFIKDYDRRFLNIKAHAFQPTVKKMPGAAGTETWDFVANEAAFLVPQIFKIEMVYVRPWNLRDNATRMEFTVLTH